MAALQGQFKTQAEAQAATQTGESQQDLAARGLLRSGIAADQTRGIRTGVYTSVAQANAQLEKQKIDADFQDKSEAISEGLQWLNSLRDYVARMASDQTQRDLGQANIQLAYARLQQELQTMREQYAQQLQFWAITHVGTTP